MTTEENSEISDFIEFNSENLILVGIKFQNGYFISVSNKVAKKLGTTAISLPISQELENITQDSSGNRSSLGRRGITTATVLGSRNELFAKALAEKLVILTNQLVYVTVNFDEDNHELFSEALQLIEKIIK